jgi:hypothetical protein
MNYVFLYSYGCAGAMLDDEEEFAWVDYLVPTECAVSPTPN